MQLLFHHYRFYVFAQDLCVSRCHQPLSGCCILSLRRHLIPQCVSVCTVCVCVCMCVCVCVCTVCVCVYACVHCMCVCVSVCVYCMCAFVCVCACVYCMCVYVELRGAKCLYKPL